MDMKVPLPVIPSINRRNAVNAGNDEDRVQRALTGNTHLHFRRSEAKHLLLPLVLLQEADSSLALWMEASNLAEMHSDSSFW